MTEVTRESKRCDECGGPLEGWTGAQHSQQCRVLISRAEALLLLDTVSLLRDIERRAASASWGTPTEAGSDAPSAYAYGRSAEACDRAAHEIENALITLSVWGKAEAAAEALNTDEDDATRDEPHHYDLDR